MIVSSRLLNRYRDIEPQLTRVAERAKAVLTQYCDENGYPFVGRVKTADSLSEKVESGRFATWSSLDDLYACSIVIPTLKHEAAVLAFLRSKFSERVTRARGATSKAPEVFRFEATRFVGTLTPPPGIDTKEPLYQLQFEVQVRTAFEHAWSAATHALVYKAGKIDWKLLRMAAQLKAAVEQLDTLVLAFESSAEVITVHPSPEVASKVLVAARLQHLLNEGVIPPECEPKDWSRFADNYVALVRAGTRGSNRDFPAKVAAALDISVAAFRAYGKSFPRSISLLQLVQGVLLERGHLQLPLSDFYPVITQELTDMFPAATKIATPFDFDS